MFPTPMVIKHFTVMAPPPYHLTPVVYQYYLKIP